VVEDIAVFGHIAVGLKRNYNLLFFAHSETYDFEKERLCFLILGIETEVVTYFQGMEN